MKADTFMASLTGHLLWKFLAIARAGSTLFSRPKSCVTVANIKMDFKQYCNYRASVHTA